MNDDMKRRWVAAQLRAAERTSTREKWAVRAVIAGIIIGLAVLGFMVAS